MANPKRQGKHTRQATEEPTPQIVAPAYDIVRGVEHRPGYQKKLALSGSAELSLRTLRASVPTRSLELKAGSRLQGRDAIA